MCALLWPLGAALAGLSATRPQATLPKAGLPSAEEFDPLDKPIWLMAIMLAAGVGGVAGESAPLLPVADAVGLSITLASGNVCGKNPLKESAFLVIIETYSRLSWWMASPT
jgi:hypothetical protein